MSQGSGAATDGLDGRAVVFDDHLFLISMRHAPARTFSLQPVFRIILCRRILQFVRGRIVLLWALALSLFTLGPVGLIAVLREVRTTTEALKGLPDLCRCINRES